MPKALDALRIQVSLPAKIPRVILSIRHFYPDGGGAEVLARRLAVRLVQRGLPLTVLTGRYGGRPRFEIIDGVLVRRHFIGLYVPVLHEVCYLTSLAWELVARRREYDLVHVFQTHLSAFVAVVVAKRLGKKVVTTCHNAGELGDMGTLTSLPGGGRLLRTVSANVDAVTGVSRDVMAQLREAGFNLKRTWYLPNGVPVPTSVPGDQSKLRDTLGLRSDGVIAVFVGRLSGEKAPELLIDAWLQVLEKYPTSQLIFVGGGQKRAMLEAKASQAGVMDSVVFTGKVSDVERYLCAADIFVLPSVTEGVSIALLEAMAVGLPVVASSVGGTVDLIDSGKNGLLFQSGDTDGLVKCLTVLIESSRLRAELGAKARKTIEESFSIEVVADRYLSLYSSLLPGMS